VFGATFVVVLLLMALLSSVLFGTTGSVSRTDSRFANHPASDLLSEPDFFGILSPDAVRHEKTSSSMAHS
jgi:hypothetical protein